MSKYIHFKYLIICYDIRKSSQYWRTLIIKPYHIIFTRFKSGLWLGHCNTCTCFCLSNCILFLALCFLSSCLKITFYCSLNSFAASNRIFLGCSLFSSTLSSFQKDPHMHHHVGIVGDVSSVMRSISFQPYIAGRGICTGQHSCLLFNL